MSGEDNRYLNRLPTRAERAGLIVLSGVIAVLGIGVCWAMVWAGTAGATADRSMLAGAAFFALVGISGLIFLFRAIFTDPKKATAKARAALAISVVCLAAVAFAVAVIERRGAASLIWSGGVLLMSASYLIRLKSK